MGATCGICGRSILAGERVHGFVGGGEERSVCELCVSRAEGLGWRPGNEPEPEPNGGNREGRLRRLFQRRDRRPGAPAPAQPAHPPAPAQPPRRRLPQPPEDELGFTPFERAIARFNSSDAGHAVAGLTRTLGIPKASVGASAGAPDEVRITVAWELSWYQWRVDIADELSPVAELGKGGEVDQLDSAARQWNASVGKDGHLRLAGERAPSR
jgi:hypothetical protein